LDLVESEKWLRKALALEPDNEIASSVLGSLLWKKGCRTEALEIVEAALSLRPDSTQLLTLKGRLVDQRREQ
jgi:predicted Zn-dependent protease